MLKPKYWITSGLLLIVLNLMSFVAHYISQALMEIFDPFKEWILYYISSLSITLFVNFIILCYFHLWLREKKIKLNLDWQSMKSALLSALILFIYYNTIILTHIPHPKLSQREITERKNQSEHKNKHKERKKAFEKQ